MRILYLDTSSSFLYCGLVDNSKLVFEIKKDLGKDLSLFCLKLISDKFNEYKISPKSIDKIILVNGPGSFTGIRIALTIAKTYSWSLNIPIVVISSLQAMACSCRNNYDFIIPIIDARRGYCYCAIFDNKLNIILKEQYLMINTLLASLDKLGSNYCLLSNGTFDFSTNKYDPDILRIVSKFKDYDTVENVHLIKANYLKRTEAEEKFNDS